MTEDSGDDGIRIFRSWNFDEITDLFSHRLAHLANGDDRGAPPRSETLVWLDEGQPTIYVGDEVPDPDFLRTRLGLPAGQDVDIAVVDSLADLRTAVQRSMAARMLDASELQKGLTAAGPDSWYEHVLATWRRRTPELVATLLAAKAGYLDAELLDATKVDDLDLWLLQWAFHCWLGLTISWCAGPSPTGETLEDDLAHYVDRMPTFPTLAERYANAIEGYNFGQHSQGRRYVLEAIRASILTRHGETPRSFDDIATWAYFYFSFSVALRHFEVSGEEGDPTATAIAEGMRRSHVGGRRAGATMTAEAAAVAAAEMADRLVAERGEQEIPEIVAVLLDAAAYAGFHLATTDVTEAIER